MWKRKLKRFYSERRLCSVRSETQSLPFLLSSSVKITLKAINASTVLLVKRAFMVAISYHQVNLVLVVPYFIQENTLYLYIHLKQNNYQNIGNFHK